MSMILSEMAVTDAEIYVMRVNNPYEADEWSELVTYIPVRWDSSMSKTEFRKDVFDVVEAIEKMYANHHDQLISIEVRFKRDYINA